MASTLEVERIANGQYIWRFKAANGKKMSWSGDTYINLADCLNGASIGSPAYNVQSSWDSNEGIVFIHDTAGAQVTANLVYIDNYDPENPKDLSDTPEAPDIMAKMVTDNPDIMFAYEGGFGYDRGHVVINGHRWHWKQDTDEECAISGCGQKMPN